MGSFWTSICKRKTLFGGLRGETLYEATLSGKSITNVTSRLSGEYGRIRVVKIGLDGYLYIATSNRDGRGTANARDDKIIRVKID
jgi:aldose sugar dehydrogenase